MIKTIRTMDIKTLDLTDERLVMEALAIHCTYPLEWEADFEQPAACVPTTLAKLETRFPKTILYIQEHGRIVGLHWVEVPTRKIGCIRSLWIDPSYRRKGWAVRLLAQGSEWLGLHDVKQIEMEIDEQNLAMRLWADKQGFHEDFGKFVRSVGIVGADRAS
jgi:ribosomal protein S18 acetylase RimI-like enzyme